MGRTRTLTYRDAAGTPSHRNAPIPPPPAIKLNLRAGDAVLTTTGRYMASLPTEQQIALAWGVPRGHLKHAPEVGHDFLTLPRANRAALESEIQRRAPLATPVDQLLASGEMEIISVRSHHPKSTESRIVVTYRLRGSSATRTFDSAHVGEVAAAEPAPPPEPIFLYVMDNAASGHGAGVKVWGYSVEQTLQYGYDGPPETTFHLPAGHAGRGHSFLQLLTGHIIIATSEVTGDPNNGGESWYVVPPNATGEIAVEDCPRIRCDELFAGTAFETIGARHAFTLHDGSVLLGSSGYWKQFTLQQILNHESVDYSTLPMWSYNGNGVVSGIGHYDTLPIPGTRKLVVQGHDRFFQLDLGLPPGQIDGTDVPGGDGLDWIALGNNIGRPAAEDWGGAIARDAGGGYWKQQGADERIAYWNADVIASLPKLGNLPGANPVPTRTMTADIITALDPNIHGMGLGLDMDGERGLWTLTIIWSPTPTQRAMLMRFSPEACATGGVQVPDRLLYLPAGERVFGMRVATQFTLQTR